MPNPSDELDTQVLSDLNTRTLVDGVPIKIDLISIALGLTPRQLRESLGRLEAQGFVRLAPGECVGLTPLGHQHLME